MTLRLKRHTNPTCVAANGVKGPFTVTAAPHAATIAPRGMAENKVIELPGSPRFATRADDLVSQLKLRQDIGQRCEAAQVTP